jgi:hypothetical protein
MDNAMVTGYEELNNISGGSESVDFWDQGP